MAGDILKWKEKKSNHIYVYYMPLYLFVFNLAGGECLVQSPEDRATSYECQIL